MDSEVREVTYISVGLILAALVLSFIMYGLTLTRTMARTSNDQSAANDKIEDYREYNRYDNQVLYGDEVIELITHKYDSGIDIFVDYRKNETTNAVVDENNLTKLATGNDCPVVDCNRDHRLYNYDSYLAHKASGNRQANYYALNYGASTANGDDLRNWYPYTSRYAGVLVYDGADILDAYNNLTVGGVIDGPGGPICPIFGRPTGGSESRVSGIILVHLVETNVGGNDVLVPDKIH